MYRLAASVVYADRSVCTLLAIIVNLLRITLLVILATILGLGTCNLLRHGATLQSNTLSPLVEGVVCTNSPLDFGETLETAELDLSFRLENRSTTETYRVTEFRTGCPCTVTTPASVTLAPGESGYVTVTVDTQRLFYGRKRSHLRSEFRETVVGWATGGRNSTQRVRMVARGAVRRWCRMYPRQVRFGGFVAGDGVLRSCRLVPFGEGSVRHLHVADSPSGISAHVQAEPEGSFRLTLQPATDIATGPVNGCVSVQAEFDSGASARRTVPISGLAQSDAALLPPFLAFGTVRAGREGGKLVKVFSRNGRPLTVTSARATDPAIAVCLVDSRVASKTYKITLKRAEPGRLEAKVCFDVLTDAGPEQTICLRVSGHIAEAPASEVRAPAAYTHQETAFRQGRIY